MDSQFKYIPMYLEALSRDELIKRMIGQNASDGYSYRYFDIQFDVQKSVWVAWFYPENDRIHKLGQKINQSGGAK